MRAINLIPADQRRGAARGAGGKPSVGVYAVLGGLGAAVVCVLAFVLLSNSINGKTEKLLTGDVAAKVKAAALAKVSGTVERVETNVDSSAPYEAHIRKADGTEVEVQVSKDYSVAAVNTMGRHP